MGKKGKIGRTSKEISMPVFSERILFSFLLWDGNNIIDIHSGPFSSQRMLPFWGKMLRDLRMEKSLKFGLSINQKQPKKGFHSKWKQIYQHENHGLQVGKSSMVPRREGLGSLQSTKQCVVANHIQISEGDVNLHCESSYRTTESNVYVLEDLIMRLLFIFFWLQTSNKLYHFAVFIVIMALLI